MKAAPAFRTVRCPAVRGASPASHQDSSRAVPRLARARRDEGTCRQSVTEKQHSQAGCSAARMHLDFDHGLPGQVVPLVVEPSSGCDGPC